MYKKHQWNIARANYSSVNVAVAVEVAVAVPIAESVPVFDAVAVGGVPAWLHYAFDIAVASVVVLVAVATAVDAGPTNTKQLEMQCYFSVLP
jgi:hypothetical protein